VPIVSLLPGIYQEDLFTAEFTGGLDDVLAPIFTTLDWLAGWMGVVIDEGWPLPRSRAFIANIAELYRWRGTIRGLTAELSIYTGGDVEITESGGIAWSLTPGSDPPGDDQPRMAVRVRVDDPSTISERTVDRMVAAAKPAHVVHVLEISARHHRGSAEPAS
jgi:hypothetical protein